jgi:ABC-2 type transport system ATP-binding protein
MNYPLSTDRISRKFGRVEAVRDLSLNVPAGSLYALLGPNGAGKTTTIFMLMNILRPTSGTATVLGVDSTRLGPPQLAQIGYVSENQNLPGWMTVEYLLDYCKPFYPTWDEEFCKSLVRRFDLPLDRKVRNLSRGMRMKLAMIAALAYHPRLLVLDEPFSGLDVSVREEMVEGMLELVERGDWTLFISSHDLEDIENLVDWIGFIDRGRLELSEETEKLRSRFREIEMTLPQGAVVPDNLPETWLKPACAGNVLRFIDSGYAEGESERRISSLFPAASNLAVSSLSLRNIFIALARKGKNRTGSGGLE